MKSYEKITNWLLTSGLCILKKDDPNAGGVYSFFDNHSKSFSFLYPEITGYNISVMKFLHSRKNSDNYLDIAKLSGSWLMNIQDKYGVIIMGVGSDPKKSELAFSFDNGICAKGLLDLFEMTKDDKYKQYAKRLLDWISTNCVDDDGTIKPVMDLKSQKFVEDSVWYMQKGCLHIKTAIPFLQYSSYDSSFKKIGTKICDNFTNFQNPDGSFSIHKSSKIINLHTHCYALEGLMYAYYFLKDIKYLESCKKGLDWMLHKINDDGSIYLWFNYKDKSKACYPIAQVIRLMILMDALEKQNKFKDITSRLVQFLLSLQAANPDPRINGGFHEEYYKSTFGWKKRDRINSWGTMFALQALIWFESYDTLSFENSMTYLF